MNSYVAAIADVIDYIEQRIADKLTLAELAARANISDFHFNRIFKTVVGITLKQYVLEPARYGYCLKADSYGQSNRGSHGPFYYRHR